MVVMAIALPLMIVCTSVVSAEATHEVECAAYECSRQEHPACLLVRHSHAGLTHGEAPSERVQL